MYALLPSCKSVPHLRENHFREVESRIFELWLLNVDPDTGALLELHRLPTRDIPSMGSPVPPRIETAQRELFHNIDV